MAKIRVRKGMPSVRVLKPDFAERFAEHFRDPKFDAVRPELEKVMAVAWDDYHKYRKSPNTHVAGKGYADPKFQLSDDWRAASEAVKAAALRQKNPRSPSRILLVNGSARSDQTCPGEESKTWRLTKIAEKIVGQTPGFEAEILDLSLLSSQYGRKIFPCKACVSTAQPLCHWPCSCYPNHALDQTGDWMHEIYPKWAAAHGVMILCPVNWYQAPSSLKVMIDRLVCADGGNPDPTSTHDKNPAMAKALEMKGWPYPLHLAGRVFSVVVHGDAAGVENLRRMLTDWLCDMGFIPAGYKALLGSYVGYYEPYATSHEALDADHDFQKEVANAAHALVEGVTLMRAGKLPQPDAGLKEPRPK